MGCHFLLQEWVEERFIDKLVGVTTDNSFKTWLSVKRKSRVIGIGSCVTVNVPLRVRSFCPPNPIKVAFNHYFIVTAFHYFILFILIALTNSCS